MQGHVSSSSAIVTAAVVAAAAAVAVVAVDSVAVADTVVVVVLAVVAKGCEFTAAGHETTNRALVLNVFRRAPKSPTAPALWAWAVAHYAMRPHTGPAARWY